MTSISYETIGNIRQMQILLGHSKIEDLIRHLSACTVHSRMVAVKNGI